MGGPGFCNGRTYNCFDNFFSQGFVVDGKKYMSSEQCYQASKFADDSWHEKIRQTWNPHQAWSLGQSREHVLIPDLEEKKEYLMYKANYAKFSQNEQLEKNLLDTGDYEINFIGSSPFWNAANGRILTKIREELRKGRG